MRMLVQADFPNQRARGGIQPVGVGLDIPEINSTKG